jgi:hypothetical protein
LGDWSRQLSLNRRYLTEVEGSREMTPSTSDQGGRMPKNSTTDWLLLGVTISVLLVSFVILCMLAMDIYSQTFGAPACQRSISQ